MRTGKNPAKAGLPAYTPQELGVALIVYIPFTQGYFENALEILEYQIASLYACTPGDFDLLVFDNGSCPEAVARLHRLQDQEKIDWLILSRHNLGKAGAWNWIFGAMPNRLICYADSDVLFRPGWLSASLEILDAFPQAGMVAAQPNFFDVMEGQGQAHKPLERNPRYQIDDYWPAEDIVDEYCRGIGATPELAARFHQEPLPAITQRESGVQGVLGASHMQFIIPRAVARQVTPLPASKGLWRSETMSLDFKIDQAGYLHLSTREPHVFHMGNTLTENLLEEVQSILGASHPVESRAEKPTFPEKSRLQRWLSALAQRPRFNRLMLRAYNLLFRALYSEN
jgi:glycosyltransferase involved in cell wall biosynthesis